MSAGPESDHDLGFLAQQMGQVFIFAGADSAVEETHVDLFIVHGFNVAVLEVHRTGPEDDIDQITNRDQMHSQLGDSDFTTPATGSPVKGDFGFSVGFCHINLLNL